MIHKRARRPEVFQAELWVTASVVFDGHSTARLDLGGELLAAAVHPRLRPELAALLAEQPERPLVCKLWPRTGPRARLRQEVCVLRAVSAEPVEPHLLVQGRVRAVGEPAGCLRLTVHPNRGGELTHPFDLTLLAAPGLLEQLERGDAVRVRGRLGEGRCLAAERVETIRLPGPRPAGEAGRKPKPRAGAPP